MHRFEGACGQTANQPLKGEHYTRPFFRPGPIVSKAETGHEGRCLNQLTRLATRPDILMRFTLTLLGFGPHTTGTELLKRNQSN